MPDRRSKDAARARSARARRPRSGDDARAATTPTTATPSEFVLTVNLEAVLWAALLFGAFALRLARLDALPLTLDESSRAFAAFQVSEGNVPVGWTGDLTGALTALLFELFGADDLLARIVPALAGGAAVGALWFSRRYVGPGVALAAAALLALSPLAVLTARSGLAFSTGVLLSVAMATSLFAYLREPRLPYLAALAASVGLALTADAVSTGTAVAVAAFLVVEGALRNEPHVARAFAAFRASPDQQWTAAVIAAATLLLGLTHFGTTGDRLGMAGLTQWADMFASPGDGRGWAYFKLLAGYDWPLAAAGLAALAVGARRLAGGQPTPLVQRFALLWGAIAVVTAILTTRHHSGQLLLLLLPFSLLAGSLLEEVTGAVDWTALRRGWPYLLTALLLTAYGLLVITEWSQGTAGGSEKAYAVLALLAAAGLIVAAYSSLGRGGAAVALTAAGVLAGAFLVHSSLSVVLSDGTEFAVDARADGRIEAFADVVARAKGDRPGPVVVDPALEEPLEWYLRDLEAKAGSPGPEAAVFVSRPGAAPAGFVAQEPPWPVAEGWYPSERDLLKLWRWLLYRTAFGNLSGIDAQVFIAQQ